MNLQTSFLNNDKRARTAIIWAIIATGVNTVLGIFIIIFAIFQGYSIFNGNNPPISILSTFLALTAVIASLGITSAVFYVRWLYRAHKNAEFIMKERLFLPAGWNVFFYFVPVFNLIVCNVLLYRIAEKTSSKDSVTTVLVFCIASGIYFVFSLLSPVNEAFSSLSSLAGLASFITFFFVVNSVNKGQKEKAGELGLLSSEDEMEF